MDFKMTNLTGLIGIFAMMAISLGMSENRQAIKWKPIAIAVGMQFILAILIAGIPKLGIKGPMNPLFQLANDAIGSILSHVDKGTDFLFGTLGHPEVIGSYIFAVKVLPTIVVFGGLFCFFLLMFNLLWMFCSIEPGKLSHGLDFQLLVPSLISG